MSACLETNRGDILSGFSESVRDFAKEARLVFMQDGVHLQGKDSAGVVMVRYSFPAAKINENGRGRYVCSCPMIDVGIDTRMIAQCLNNVSCGDLVGLSVDTENDPDVLTIRCQNAVTGKRSTLRVITPETSDDPITHNSIETCGYNSEITMSSALFHEMMRDLNKSDATSVRVCCDGARLVLVANGRHIKAAFEVKRGNDQSQFSYSPKPSDRWPVCECYSRTFLQKVAKAKGVSQYISIHLLPNFMVGFAYKTCVGTLSYMICPREDDEWTENPATRVMPPISQEIVGILPRTRTSSGKKRMLEDLAHATKSRLDPDLGAGGNSLDAADGASCEAREATADRGFHDDSDGDDGSSSEDGMHQDSDLDDPGAGDGVVVTTTVSDDEEDGGRGDGNVAAACAPRKRMRT